MEKVEINTEFIKLDQFLKYSGAAFTGGEAKLMISDGIVSVNGETVFQRGKKIRPGDIVTVYADDGEIEFKAVSPD